MPLVSILTAAYAPTADHLPATIESVREQVLPDGWELEWIVQEDGPNPKLADLFNGLDFVRYQANGAQLGLAPTRNLALSRASGSLLQVLDHDDLLLPGALNTLIPRFDDNSVHWAIGQADDLLPDGTRKEYKSALPFGILPAGSVNAWAAENGGNWPIHCANLMLRTVYLRAIGGWVASPADDDLAMFAALSEIVAGYHEESLTWLYRHHAQQTHRSPAWQVWSERGRRISLQRAAAVRATGLNFPDLLGDVVAEKVEVGALHAKITIPDTNTAD